MMQVAQPTSLLPFFLTQTILILFSASVYPTEGKSISQPPLHLGWPWDTVLLNEISANATKNFWESSFKESQFSQPLTFALFDISLLLAGSPDSKLEMEQLTWDRSGNTRSQFPDGCKGPALSTGHRLLIERTLCPSPLPSPNRFSHQGACGAPTEGGVGDSWYWHLLSTRLADGEFLFQVVILNADGCMLE